MRCWRAGSRWVLGQVLPAQVAFGGADCLARSHSGLIPAVLFSCDHVGLGYCSSACLAYSHGQLGDVRGGGYQDLGLDDVAG